MRVIYVRFDVGKESVAVLPSAEVVFAGDEIVWEVSVIGGSIKRVELEIKHGKKPSFTLGGSKKELHSEKIRNKRARIRGVAPKVKGSGHARYKYTIRGFDGSDEELIKLDPVIIIVPPEQPE